MVMSFHQHYWPGVNCIDRIFSDIIAYLYSEDLGPLLWIGEGEFFLSSEKRVIGNNKKERILEEIFNIKFLKQKIQAEEGLNVLKKVKDFLSRGIPVPLMFDNFYYQVDSNFQKEHIYHLVTACGLDEKNDLYILDQYYKNKLEILSKEEFLRFCTEAWFICGDGRMQKINSDDCISLLDKYLGDITLRIDNVKNFIDYIKEEVLTHDHINDIGDIMEIPIVRDINTVRVTRREFFWTIKYLINKFDLFELCIPAHYMRQLLEKWDLVFSLFAKYFLGNSKLMKVKEIDAQLREILILEERYMVEMKKVLEGLLYKER